MYQLAEVSSVRTAREPHRQHDSTWLPSQEVGNPDQVMAPMPTVHPGSSERHPVNRGPSPGKLLTYGSLDRASGNGSGTRKAGLFCASLVLFKHVDYCSLIIEILCFPGCFVEFALRPKRLTYIQA